MSHQLPELVTASSRLRLAQFSARSQAIVYHVLALPLPISQVNKVSAHWLKFWEAQGVFGFLTGLFREHLFKLREN